MKLKGMSYIEEFFAKGGALARALEGYEFRGAQLDMARSIMETFENGGLYCCEAGTGIGKTLAYLLPSVLWSIEAKERVIVSTHTKNLQEQITGRDLPLLSSILPMPFTYIIVKGKGNYLCLKRWRNYAAQRHLDIPGDKEDRLEALAEWVRGTRTGDLGSSSPIDARRDRELWNSLRCDTYFCNDTACEDYRRCYFKNARRRAQSANIVVVNHSLLIADKVADGGVLGEYDHLVVDETQDLARVAREGLREVIEPRGLIRHLRAVTGILGRGRRKDSVAGRMTRETREGIRRRCRGMEKTIDEFFGAPAFGSGSIDQGESRFVGRVRYVRGDDIARDLRESGDHLIGDLQGLTDLMYDSAREMEDGPSSDEMLEYEGYIEILREAEKTLRLLIDADDGSMVYWIEKPAMSGISAGSINAAPIDVAPQLREILFSGLRTGIFTSATMRVMGGFDFFLRSTGLSEMDDRSRPSQVFPSPFCYEEQAMVVVPSFLPDPRDDLFADRLTDLLRDTILSLNRGTLVLFTSNSLLEECYRRLRDELAGEGIRVLGQGIDGSREQITRVFREDRRSVLFGTDSFWEGVDIRGESLEVLIFTRLPFSVPSDPYSRAMDEWIRERGGNPFVEFFLPTAVMKFRQGFGRLIRSGRDRGIAMIMDNRILRQRYGKAFADDLPVAPIEVSDPSSWIPTLKRWWSEPAESARRGAKRLVPDALDGAAE